LPIEKWDKIKQLQEKWFKVAMVWDGINDAIALSQADVWIAMWTGTDVAIESADLTLLGWKIEQLTTAIKISKDTIRTIKQNLFFSFFYNTLAIPIACGILYLPFWILLNPAVEWIAMVFSSVSVVLNSLRLRK
jgi:P-type E1-E2 ATPase